MKKNADYYLNGLKTCGEKFTKKITTYDLHVLRWLSFLAGMLFASCLPKLTKKLRGLFVLISFILMLPMIFRMLGVIKNVFKCNWKWI